MYIGLLEWTSGTTLSESTNLLHNPNVGGRSGLFCIDQNTEPGELLQWLCHDDSTINIVVSYRYHMSFIFDS